MRRSFIASALTAGVLAIPATAGALGATDEDNHIFGAGFARLDPAGNPAEIALLRHDAAEQAREARRDRRSERRQGRGANAAAAPKVAVPPHLQAIAQCESGGNPRAIGGGGAFRGKYQFTVATWQAVGGSGDPAAAPEAEQDRRAAMLYERAGPGQWPVCGS